MKQKFRQNVAAIETLRRIEERNRTATPAEQAVLVKYVGWGGMPQVFAEVPPKDWREEHEQIAQLLTKEEFAAARASTLNAHYTAPEVIQAMYAAVERLGLQGGRILEPSCGLGHFIGLMPEAMHAQSPVTGIELDSITARLAQKLYPNADIRQGAYEEAQLTDGAFDLAISNVPFGDCREPVRSSRSGLTKRRRCGASFKPRTPFSLMSSARGKPTQWWPQGWSQNGWDWRKSRCSPSLITCWSNSPRNY
jgi:hypothetical protein